MRKYKLTFHLKGGTKLNIFCDDFDISKLSGQKGRTISIDNSDRVWSIDVDQIEGWTAVRIWRFLAPLYSIY
jgi:hypothetical protein